MSRRAIRYLGTHSGRYPWLTLLLVALLTAAAAWAAYTRFEIEMDVAALLPPQSEAAEAMRNPLRDFLGQGFLLVALEITKGAPQEVQENPEAFLRDAKPFVERALDDQRYFSERRVLLGQRDLGIGDNAAALATLFTEEDFSRLEELASPSQLRDRVRDIVTRLGDEPTTDALVAASQDPMGLESMLREHATYYIGPLQTDHPEGLHISEDGRMLLLVLYPAASSTNLIEGRELAAFLEATRAGLYKRHPQWRGALDINFVGAHIEAAEGATDVRRDIYKTSVVSLAAVLLLFLVAFRQPEALLFVAVPLVVGVVWTLGFTSLFIDRITQVTLTFAAILVGLGIDFSIHLYNRFQEGLRLGAGREGALRDAIWHTGPSITAGAITTLIAFFGMSFTQFTGFRELGIFGTVGIAMSLLAMVLVLPPLMMIFTGWSSRVAQPTATLGLKKVTFMVQSYPRITVAAGLCILVYMGIHARDVSFNDDFRNLRQPSQDYQELRERIESQFYLPSNQVFIITEDEDFNRVLERNDQLYQDIDALRGSYGLLGIDSLRLVFPAPETQRRNLQRLLAFPLEDVEGTLRLLLSDYPQLPRDFFDRFLLKVEEVQAGARAAIETGGPLLGPGYVESEQYAAIVIQYIYHDTRSGMYRVITRVYPEVGTWVDAVPETFIEAITQQGESAPLVLGNAVLAQELKQLLIRDLTLVVLFVFLLVLLYLIKYFKRPRLTWGQAVLRGLLATVPVAFAMLITFGVMNIFGMQLNYLNIIAIPMIVGIGVDSGIHLLGRFYENESHNMQFAIERTGRAIVITNLTTVFGFGSLAIASFQGIGEIGKLVIIGVAATLFAALLFLPAVLKLLDPRFTYVGGAGDEIG